MPVNRSAPLPLAKADPDERLYLRDLELDQAAAQIIAAARRLARLAENSAAAAGRLSHAELELLLELQDAGRLDVTGLRTRLGWPRQSLARALTALEGQGLIDRRPAGSDRRQRIVALTPEGAGLVRQATEKRRAELRRSFLAAGPEAAQGARRVLVEFLRTGDTER